MIRHLTINSSPPLERRGISVSRQATARSESRGGDADGGAGKIDLTKDGVH